MNNRYGTLLVFDHHEMGSVNKIVVLYVPTYSDLEEKLAFFEQLTGYPIDHERYHTDVIDLTNYFFSKGYGGDVSKIEQILHKLAPEVLKSIEKGEAPNSLLRVHRHGDRQIWLNRNYDKVSAFMRQEQEAGVARRLASKIETSRLS